MKKSKLVGSIFGGIVVFVLGIFMGYFIGVFQTSGHRVDFSKRKEALQIRTESYEPSCDELKKVGKPRVTKQGKDTIVVDVSEDYFVVFGLNAEPGKVPVTAWWGAGRAAAMKQACD
jgi:hypothetical protein